MYSDVEISRKQAMVSTTRMIVISRLLNKKINREFKLHRKLYLPKNKW